MLGLRCKFIGVGRERATGLEEGLKFSTSSSSFLDAGFLFLDKGEGKGAEGASPCAFGDEAFETLGEGGSVGGLLRELPVLGPLGDPRPFGSRVRIFLALLVLAFSSSSEETQVLGSLFS
jgi:hypothetical protein